MEQKQSMQKKSLWLHVPKYHMGCVYKSKLMFLIKKTQNPPNQEANVLLQNKSSDNGFQYTLSVQIKMSNPHQHYWEGICLHCLILIGSTGGSRVGRPIWTTNWKAFYKNIHKPMGHNRQTQLYNVQKLLHLFIGPEHHSTFTDNTGLDQSKRPCKYLFSCSYR